MGRLSRCGSQEQRLGADPLVRRLSTVEDCLKLWKRLRDRYTQELKAIEQAKRSGSGNVSRRTWEFAESMAFYRDCGRPRKTTCSMEAPSYSGSDDVGETAENILTGMCTTPPLPSAVESFLDAPPELPPPATPASSVTE
ncbi:uncharacterized protein LOC142591241 [Dermacentor variabilis]|uniref:uncharacterized protein LOC142591241 n=1 Tax=Dermacentor variabilis TaxID=34621 RepID=UPI003F5C0EDD